MKYYILRIGIILLIAIAYILNITVFKPNYVYKENFENSSSVRFLISNAPYKIHFKGLTNETSYEGSKSFKMDLTIYGDGNKECYYYWMIPVSVILKGKANFRCYLHGDKESLKYVRAGLNFSYPPEEPFKVSEKMMDENWIKLEETYPSYNSEQASMFANDIIYDRIAGKNINDINKIGIFIRGIGKHRITFNIDAIEITGKKSDEDFNSVLNKRLVDEKKKYQRLLEYDTLLKSNSRENKISKLQVKREEINKLISKLEDSEVKSPKDIDKLELLVELYPSHQKIVNAKLTNPASDADIFYLPPTKYNRLTEDNIPAGIKTLDKFEARVAAGQYEPFSLLIQARNKLDNIKIDWTDLKSSGGVIPKNMLDVSIAKVWYQAGIKFNENKDHVLTQELLIKNDNLIKVDRDKKTNLLLAKNNGGQSYVDVQTLTEDNQINLTVEDSKDLLPFSIEQNKNKQIWFTLHIPDNTKPGNYSGTITVTGNNNTIQSFPINIEVLPFKLDPPRLLYAMYYHGYVDNKTNRPMHFTNKTEAQYRIEMNDLKEHGIMYPTTYQVLKNIDPDLRIRKEVGLPNDKLFSVGMVTGNPQKDDELNNLKQQIKQWYDKIEQYGYKQLFVYGIDEARGEQLRSQRKAWQAVKEAGARVFVSGYYETFQDVGDILDAAIIQKEPQKEQALLYHSKGNMVLSYGNPQAGEENPEIYRRNFGFLLWQNEYDGAMDYAYQKNYGSTWNDWDHKKYRDQNFTYPVSNGILSTVQWEGFRQGINDIRFLSTLLNALDAAEKKGKNVSAIRSWVNSIDSSGNLDEIRSEIIDKILEVTGK